MSEEKNLCFGPPNYRGGDQPDAWVITLMNRNKTHQEVTEIVRALQDKLGLSEEDAAASVFRGDPSDWRKPGYFSSDGRQRLQVFNLAYGESVPPFARLGPNPTARELLEQTLYEADTKHDALKRYILRALDGVMSMTICEHTKKYLGTIVEKIHDHSFLQR